jgi:hypothetical protein
MNAEEIETIRPRSTDDTLGLRVTALLLHRIFSPNHEEVLESRTANLLRLDEAVCKKKGGKNLVVGDEATGYRSIFGTPCIHGVSQTP